MAVGLTPAYSDRIVQDFHLIPYYLIDASMGTEKLFLEYNSVLKMSSGFVQIPEFLYADII